MIYYSKSHSPRTVFPLIPSPAFRSPPYAVFNSLSHVWLSVTAWTIPRQAPLSMGILQARTLEWVVMSSSRGSSQPRDRIQVSHIAGDFFTIWATWEAQEYWSGVGEKCSQLALVSQCKLISIPPNTSTSDEDSFNKYLKRRKGWCGFWGLPKK